MKQIKLPRHAWMLALALSLGIHAEAQHKLHDISGMQARFGASVKERFTMKNGTLAPIPLSRAGAQKPTVTTSRLIAFYTHEFDGAQYIGTGDSSRIYWSGTRGRDFDYAKFILFGQLYNLMEPASYKTELDLMLPLYKTMTFDSLNAYAWNGGAGSFSDPTRRNISSLAGNGLLQSATTYVWSGGTWEADYRSLLTWDNNNMTVLLSQDWDGALWENDTRTSLDYNTAQNVTQSLAAEWDAGASAWENKNRQVFTFAGNDLTTVLMQDWVTPGNVWENDSRQTLGYDNNQWTSSVFQDWDNITTSWINDYRTNYTYDQEHVSQVLEQDWNMLTTVWDNDDRSTYTYDANGNITSLVIQSWDGTAWEQDSRYTYVYTTSGTESITTITYEGWNSVSSSWENEDRLIIKYNEHDRIKEVLFQTWDMGGFWDVVSGDDRYSFIYETFDDGTTPGNVEKVTQNQNLRFYPNPASTYVTVDAGDDVLMNVRITDITGRVVAEVMPAGDKTHSLRVSTAEFIPGIYFLQVQYGGGKTEVASVLIQR